MPRTSRRSLTPLNVVLGALATGGVIAAVVVVGPESSATTTRERTVTVTKGVVQSTVSGSGNLSPANTMDLAFGATGKVTKVYVKAGQHVTTGQLLARIDPTAAEVDLAEAQATLSSAQDTLDAIESGTTTAPASTAAPATISEPATTTVPAAKTTATTTTPSVGSDSRSGSSGTTGSSGSGSTMSEASAVAAVKSAQLAVDNAQDALTETALRAPAAATVAAVNGAVGDQVSAGSSGASSGSGSGTGSGSTGSDASASSSSSSSGFITLAQLSRMHLEVSLSESDINSVKVGQQATVTINAASGEQVAGKVMDIGVLSSSSSSTGTSSAVSYPVTIALTQTTKGLRAGMSATAEIVTGQAAGVVVPTQALQGSLVTVVKDGKRTTQGVTVGVAGDSTTQIVSGLSVGQQVIVTSTSAAAGASASGSGASGAGGLTGRTGRTGLGTGFGGGTGGFPGGGGPPAGFAGGGGR
jgi:multidrug efflux pump subunit AcrA (membrane-fusion protein)